MPWFDPHESRREAWDGSAGRGGDVRSTYERAVNTGWPYERRDQIKLGPSSVEGAFRTRKYSHARVFYDMAVETAGRVKLVARGHFWGDDEEHQQFRAQYRRESEPTETEPFDEYVTWTRYRFGTVHREEGGLRFVPDDERTEETMRDLAWEEFFSPDKLRLAELELVRNPALARHILRDEDAWHDVCDALRYNPAAFDAPP